MIQRYSKLCGDELCWYAADFNWITLWPTLSKYDCTLHRCSTGLIRSGDTQACGGNNKRLSYDKCKSIKVDFNKTRCFALGRPNSGTVARYPEMQTLGSLWGVQGQTVPSLCGQSPENPVRPPFWFLVENFLIDWCTNIDKWNVWSCPTCRNNAKVCYLAAFHTFEEPLRNISRLSHTMMKELVS